MDDRPQFANLRVLLVEDNARLQQMMARSLESLGCIVTRANDAAHALEVLQTHAEFEMMLSDIRMPGEIDGLGLAEWVTAHRPNIAVLLLTGFTQAGNDSFQLLQKPFGMDHLVEAMTRVIDSRTQPNSAATRA